jgi:hypothetical protein
MQQRETLIVTSVALVLVGGPLVLGLAGLIGGRRVDNARSAPMPWDWRLTIGSALLYVLAFNLTFFIQELFLVLPKAFTPGLRPTLFHNNHGWEGDHPLARLFQGTGALATFLTAAICVEFLRRQSRRSSTLRLFLIWMAYSGFFMSLPQVVVGAIIPQNDVGMAMDYLGLGVTSKTMAALVALAMIPPLALWLTRQLLSLAENPAFIADARARTRFIFQVATLPALAANVLIIPFRVPREWIEVIIVPAVVTLVGITWMQAGAWRISAVNSGGRLADRSIVYSIAAVVILLLLFQLVLRPGVRFY